MPVQVHVVQHGHVADAALQLVRGRVHRGYRQLDLLP